MPGPGAEFWQRRCECRERQWQEALARVFVMRAELVRLGVTDPAILGDGVLCVTSPYIRSSHEIALRDGSATNPVCIGRAIESAIAAGPIDLLDDGGPEPVPMTTEEFRDLLATIFPPAPTS